MESCSLSPWRVPCSHPADESAVFDMKQMPPCLSVECWFMGKCTMHVSVFNQNPFLATPLFQLAHFPAEPGCYSGFFLWRLNLLLCD